MKPQPGAPDATGPGAIGTCTSVQETTLFRPVVVAPTYNNAATLLGILGRIVDLGLPVVVVNDGCTDGTARLLDEWHASPARAGDSAARVEVVRHRRNMGKARALLSGFEAGAAHAYTHAVTIDTDGQLDPESIPSLLEVAQRAPTALVLGVREERIDGCPGRSLLGRRLSNLAIRLECGARVRDSQCGLRVYPLDAVVGERPPRWTGTRFSFEAEVITRLAWSGRPIQEVGVACRYLPLDIRVSHFRPWRDSVRGAGLHARLLGAAWRARRRGRG